MLARGTGGAGVNSVGGVGRPRWCVGAILAQMSMLICNFEENAMRNSRGVSAVAAVGVLAFSLAGCSATQTASGGNTGKSFTSAEKTNEKTTFTQAH